MLITVALRMGRFRDNLPVINPATARQGKAMMTYFINNLHTFAAIAKEKPFFSRASRIPVISKFTNKKMYRDATASNQPGNIARQSICNRCISGF
jgi:hypothetical protein